MCGFCGFTGQIASPEEILESMKNKIIHRGPDSDGSHLDDGIAMGFRRLSFVDLEGGSQPIYNETRDMVITFNGEIYNHRELREELEAKGHVMGRSRLRSAVCPRKYISPPAARRAPTLACAVPLTSTDIKRAVSSRPRSNTRQPSTPQSSLLRTALTWFSLRRMQPATSRPRC